MNITEVISQLKQKDNKAAYEYCKQLVAESAESNQYYEGMESFLELLDDKSSYIRTRGFLLICAQARWDECGKIAENFDQMSLLLNDSKPTVVRQCLSALHEVALYRPELAERMEAVLQNIHLEDYKDSMSPLIKKDIDELLSVL